MTTELDRLEPYSDADNLRVIVESPRGARAKYEYSPECSTFHIKRPLPVGLAYPFDWGFIPGTRAADGDPIDVMLLGDHVSYPGTLVEAHVLAILHLSERPADASGVQENPRIIAVPEWVQPSLGKALLEPLRDEIQEFLMRVGEDAGKKIIDAQWGSAEEGDAFVKAHRRRA